MFLMQLCRFQRRRGGITPTPITGRPISIPATPQGRWTRPLRIPRISARPGP